MHDYQVRTEDRPEWRTVTRDLLDQLVATEAVIEWRSRTAMPGTYTVWP